MEESRERGFVLTEDQFNDIKILSAKMEHIGSTISLVSPDELLVGDHEAFYQNFGEIISNSCTKVLKS